MMNNIFKNLLELVDYIYSEEGRENNLKRIVDIKIERIHGLDRLGLGYGTYYPTISLGYNNLNEFVGGTRSANSNLDWMRAKLSEMLLFTENGSRQALKNIFLGMYISKIEKELHYNEELDCFEISFFTFTEGKVQGRSREKLTLLIEPVGEYSPEEQSVEKKEEEITTEDILGTFSEEEKEETKNTYNDWSGWDSVFGGANWE